jgi:D-glycero-alpha-D-manno-heptose-7-phosphate kinase
MIISRTPVRVSFVGGGSDLPVFYHRSPGAVLSTAIDKYIYVTINKKFDDGIRIAYSKNEEVDSVEEIEHKLVRTVMDHMSLKGGVEITTIADIPSHGTGLGSSSSFTVGLINALNAFTGRVSAASYLGKEACFIEIERCGEPIGKQDQYAAAYGGFNLIEFFPDESVRVAPVICTPATMSDIESSLLLFYTGIGRSASKILREQSTNVASDEKVYVTLKDMVSLTYTLRDELQKGNPSALGHFLNENWQLKKRLSSEITNSQIDHWYSTALSAGAIGGKILGAGAGGFLLFFAPPDRHEVIIKALYPLRQIRFKFEKTGSRIIFLHGD